MLNFPATVRIFVALDPIDMRKSHHGLAAIVQTQLGLDPLSGHFVFFTNKRRNLAKILFFDRSGLAILFNYLGSHYTSSGSSFQIECSRFSALYG